MNAWKYFSLHFQYLLTFIFIPTTFSTQMNRNATECRGLTKPFLCLTLSFSGVAWRLSPGVPTLGVVRDQASFNKVRYLSCDGFSLHSVCCSFNRAMINPNSPPHQSNIRLPPRLSTQLNSPGYLPTLWVLCQAQILEITVVYLQSSQVQLNYFVSLRSIETSVSCIKMLTRFSI